MTSDKLSLLLKTTTQIYVRCIKASSIALLKNWPLLPATLVLFVLFQLSLHLFAPLGLAGGFLVGMLSLILLCYFYSWIAEVVSNRSIPWTKKSSYLFEPNLFFSLLSAAFILYLFQLVVSAFTQGLQEAQLLVPSVKLIVVIIFNALAEVVYIHRYQGLAAFSYSAQFVRDNWIEWFLPFLLLFIPWLMAGPLIFFLALSSVNPLMPSLFAVTSVLRAFEDTNALLMVLISLMFALWYTIFRGYLFKELDSGSRRQRMFRAGSI
jgi:hypothetical protein